MIVREYMKSWFVVDLLAIMPFELFIDSQNNFSGVVRIARIGRMYKLIKMTRLLRILKIVKERSKLLKYLNDILKIGLGFERLFFFMILFLIVMHFLTCFWIIAG